MVRKAPKCKIGFPCGKTCINRQRQCYANLSTKDNKVAETFSQFVNRLVGIGNSNQSSIEAQLENLSKPINNLKPDDIKKDFLDSIYNLDKEYKTDNYLPIYHLRDKYKDIHSREELDNIIYELISENKLKVSRLIDASQFTDEQIEAGIPQSIGGPIFYLMLNDDYKPLTNIDNTFDNTIDNISDTTIDKGDVIKNSFKTGEYKQEHHEAIIDYTGNGFRNINKVLRGYEPIAETKEEINKKIKKLEKAYEALNPLKEDTITYRGAYLPSEIIDNIVVGGEWTDSGYSSSSRSLDIVQEGAFSGNILFIYNLKGGTNNAKDISKIGLEHEEEILINKGSKWKITKVEEQESEWEDEMIKVIYLEEI